MHRTRAWTQKQRVCPVFWYPGNTLAATTKLARITGAAVLPFEIRRLPDPASGYALTIQPPVEDFPGDDETADASRFNALLEAQVRASRAIPVAAPALQETAGG